MTHAEQIGGTRTNLVFRQFHRILTEFNKTPERLHQVVLYRKFYYPICNLGARRTGDSLSHGTIKVVVPWANDDGFVINAGGLGHLVKPSCGFLVVFRDATP